MAKHVTYRLRLLIVALLVAVSANAQQLGLKTNVLYWATTTPNIGLELQTGRKHTIQAFYGINPWKFKDNKSIRHWVIQPEYRYWFCQTFNGWFLGSKSLRITDTKDGLQAADSQPATSGHCPNTGIWRLRSV